MYCIKCLQGSGRDPNSLHLMYCSRSWSWMATEKKKTAESGKTRLSSPLEITVTLLPTVYLPVPMDAPSRRLILSPPSLSDTHGRLKLFRRSKNIDDPEHKPYQNPSFVAAPSARAKSVMSEGNILIHEAVRTSRLAAVVVGDMPKPGL